MRRSRSLRRRYGRSGGDAGVKFGALAVGDTFNFISPDFSINSFYLRCTKTGRLSYEWVDRGMKLRSRVKNVNVLVYHVNEG